VVRIGSFLRYPLNIIHWCECYVFKLLLHTSMFFFQPHTWLFLRKAFCYAISGVTKLWNERSGSSNPMTGHISSLLKGHFLTLLCCYAVKRSFLKVQHSAKCTNGITREEKSTSDLNFCVGVCKHPPHFLEKREVYSLWYFFCTFKNELVLRGKMSFKSGDEQSVCTYISAHQVNLCWYAGIAKLHGGVIMFLKRYAWA